MKKIVLFTLVVLTFSQISFSQPTADLYLGLTPPGYTPEIFAEGIVSLVGRNERVITFSPSGHEIFFAIGDWPTRSTMYIQYKDGAWTTQDTATFSKGRSAEETFFSLDGSRVYYYAYPAGSTSNPDIYYSEKNDGIWSNPINLGNTLNTTGEEYHPNIVNDGSIYFSKSSGKTWRAQFNGVDFESSVILPTNVNSVWGDHYVAPDENFMIFTSNKTGGFGSSDLYISFRNFDGSWTAPQNMGNTINTTAYEGSADITPDGKYMTYSRDLGGNNEIYWVSIENTIEELQATSGVITVSDTYLGLTPPGYTPEVFAPEIVSLSTRNERVITFSPSGHEIFFQVGNWPTTSIMYVQFINGAWTSPEVASFSTDQPVGEPFFSKDGNKIYYYAFQPGSSSNSNIYYSEKAENVWSEPISVGSVINSNTDEYHPTVINDGSMYFSNYAGEVFRSQFNGTSYEEEISIPSNVNFGGYVWGDHYVAPDENYMVFGAIKTGGFGNKDLYISFKNADNSWTEPQNFGNTINTAANEFAPDITPDGKYMTYDRNNDIYWVAVENTIEELRAASGVISSIDNITKQQISIYPNPSNGEINISLGEKTNKNVIFEIFDITGKLVKHETYQSISEKTFDLTNYPKGIYILKINIEGEIFNEKICVE